MGAFAAPLASPFGSGFSFVPVAPSLTQLDTLGATPAGDLTGQLDQLLDPITHDYLRTTNGEWAQTADSRTIFMIAMEQRLGASPFDPGHGSAVRQMLEDGTATPESVKAETERVGALLASNNVLSDLVVRIRDEDGEYLVDEDGMQIVKASWRDLASGSPINQNIQAGA